MALRAFFLGSWPIYSLTQSVVNFLKDPFSHETEKSQRRAKDKVTNSQIVIYTADI